MAFTFAPELVPNPNPKAPLAAILRFSMTQPAGGVVRVKNAEFEHDIQIPKEGGPREVIVAGMRPGVPHSVTLALDGCDEVSFDHTPPLLPDSLLETPPLTMLTSETGAMEPGFLFLSIRRRNVTRALWWTAKQKAFAQRWSLLVALDPMGQIVWTFHHDFRISGLSRLANGNIFFHQVNNQSFEIDLAGNVVRSWVAARRPAGPAPGAIPIDVQSLHHQPHITAAGNFLSMAANTRQIEGYVTSETDPDAPRETKGVVGDTIIEFSPEGEVIWSWDAFDHLDPHRIGYHVLEPYWDTRGFPGHADWTHGNGVTEDPRDGAVVMSLKHQDAILKVDRSGDIRWILGVHDGWGEAFQSKLLTPVGDLTWHWHGHNPRVTPDGTIIMYDNAILQARPYDRPKPPAACFARAVEFAVDENTMTVQQVWSTETDDPADQVTSWAMGDAHRLPQTNNRLVIDSFCLPDEDPLDARGAVFKSDLTWNERVRSEWHPSDFSYQARVREYRGASREIVFELRLTDPSGVMGWEIFGGHKAPVFGPAPEENHEHER